MCASDQLTALDATFLELEQADESALMHMRSARLRRPPTVRRRPSGRCESTSINAWICSPRCRQKLDAPRTGGLAWPSWEADQRFELARAKLPSPAEEREFLDWISDFYSHRLDRSRPLWEIVLLDGLADGRWALVWKTHHCLVDGVGSVGIVDLLLDSEPAPREPAAPHSAPVLVSDEVKHGRLPHPLQPVGQAAAAGIAAARAGAHALIWEEVCQGGRRFLAGVASGRLWLGVWVAAGAARALQADMRGLATSGRAVRRAGAAV